MARYMHPERELNGETPSGRLGCASFGLLGYSLMLAAFAGFSLLCAGLSLNGAMMAGRSPKLLSSGAELESWRLSELRRWEILAPGHTPQLYHDHSEWADGASGCMVVDGVLTRWDEELETGSIALAGAQVGSDGDAQTPTVWVRDAHLRLDCPFGPEEGGDRFYRMLLAESEQERP